LSHPLIVV